MIVLDILLDGLFAAVAAIGFSTLSDPPRRAFPRIALLAAIGQGEELLRQAGFPVVRLRTHPGPGGLLRRREGHGP